MSYSEQKSNFGENVQNAKKDVENRMNSASSSVKNEASELQQSVMRGASDLADNVSSKLKTVGVNTDIMVDAAKGSASDLQKMITEELRIRPMRSLGIAAAIGLVFGMLSTRS